MENSTTRLPDFDNSISAKPSQNNKKVYTVLELQSILGVELSTIYRLIKSKQFHSVRTGNRVLVSKKSFDEWLQI